MFNKIRNLYVKYQVKRGKAVNIWLKNKFPGGELSNLRTHPFVFDSVPCQCMEAFLQSLKTPDTKEQLRICSLCGRKAKRSSTTQWKTDQVVYWKGEPIKRQSPEFLDLLRRAYRALFDQDESFRSALLQTRGMRLYHTLGINDPTQTILTEQEFVQILTELRDQLDPAKDQLQQTAPACYRKRCPFRILCRS